MDMDKRMENNIVTLSGKIFSQPVFSHTLFEEQFYTFDLCVLRLSGNCDILPCMICQKTMATVNLFEGDMVSIQGQLRSHNKIVDGCSRLELRVFVKDIEMETDATPDVNTIELTGYICKPTTYRVTPFGREITDMLVAVNRAYNKSDYIPVICWGRNARFAKGLEVGDRIAATGRIQSRDYEKKLEGGNVMKRTAYEVSISSISKVEQ